MISKKKNTGTFDRQHYQVSLAAYYKAERRGFSPGYELEDWLEAERDILGDTVDNKKRDLDMGTSIID